MEKQLPIIASDFVALYREALQQSLLTPERLTIDAFQALFDRMHIEYLHYAGSTPGQSYNVEVIENLFQLAAAYLSLPTDVCPTARAFGLYLLFCLYGSQPTMESSPVKVPVALGTLKSYLDDMDKSVGNTERPTAAAQLGRRVTDGERRVLLALHQAGAWHVMPFVDVSVSVQTLLKVHDAEGVPLGKTTAKQSHKKQQRVAKAVKLDEGLLKELEAYEAMKQRLGLDNILERH